MLAEWVQVRIAVICMCAGTHLQVHGEPCVVNFHEPTPETFNVLVEQPEGRAVHLHTV